MQTMCLIVAYLSSVRLCVLADSNAQHSKRKLYELLGAEQRVMLGVVHFAAGFLVLLLVRPMSHSAFTEKLRRHIPHT